MKTLFTNAATVGYSRLIALLFVLYAFSGQLFAQGKCIAHFDAKADTGALYTVKFTGSVNPANTVYAWTFGDGNTGSGKIASNVYATPGKYYVCLTVTDSTLCNATFCDSIQVGPKPPPPPKCNADFSFSNDTAKNGIRFKANSNDSSRTYTWTFGDGGTSTDKNPTHVYSGPGKYQICLTVNDSTLCTDTHCDSIQVGPKPPPPPKCNADFDASPSDSGQNGILFKSAGNEPRTTYSWTFGDGGTSTDKNPTHFYSGPGKYQVCLTVNDSTLCTATHCDSIQVGPKPPPPPKCNADFSFSNDTAKNGIRFKANSTDTSRTYSWTFGDGGTSTDKNPTHIYSGPGKYEVCLAVNDSTLCTATHCDSIQVGPKPPPPPKCNADFDASKDTALNGIRFKSAGNEPRTTYSWAFGDGGTSTDKNPTHIYSGPGVYEVCLTVNDSTLCTATHCDNVRVGPKPPKCNAHFKHSNGGKDNELHFNAGSNPPHTYYSWNFGDDSTSAKRDPKHTYANPGTYYVCLTVTDTAKDEQVCNSTECDSVHVGGKPPRHGDCNADFDVHSDTAANTVRFMHKPNAKEATYFWDFGDGGTSSDPNPLHTFNDSGSFYVCLTVMDSTLCKETKCDSVSLRKVHKRMADGPNNLSDAASATVYPNPITEAAVIHIENASDVVSFKLYDVTGRMALAKDNLTNGNFELSRKDLPNGIYYYEVLEGNSVIGNGKLIIQ